MGRIETPTRQNPAAGPRSGQDTLNEPKPARLVTVNLTHGNPEIPCGKWVRRSLRNGRTGGRFGRDGAYARTGAGY